ncbi:pyridoxamine 5'-phosphate oxidase family protein [Yoonia sp.]|uniref:pyridoxamine 5'-phosphate oxidase family protein n=1 Tax=Yoonia sp. TaxID=2212373 RepID=UPI00391A9760
MGKQFAELSYAHQAFITAQPLFFTGTAARDGKVNISPKGMDSLRVLDATTIAYVNATGSGNETAGHLLDHPRMTLMWCSFNKRPQILRTYGTARTIHPRDAEWRVLAAQLPDVPGARQIYVQSIEMVQTSCGYAVPFMELVGERDTLRHWADDKGPDGVATYWKDRNQATLDGLPTKVIE